MCLLVFSMVEFLLTFERRPRQKRLLLLLGGLVNPSTMMLWLREWYTSPTLLLSS